MLANSRYIVIYKDSATARNLYFGSFVSQSYAEHFMDTLPDPLEGGTKTFKSLQPYTHNEDTLARDVILRKRAHGDLIDSLFT